MFIPGKAVGLCILCHPQKAIIRNCPLPCVIISPGMFYDLQDCTRVQLTAPSYQICEGTFTDPPYTEWYIPKPTQDPFTGKLISNHEHSDPLQIPSRCPLPTSMEYSLPSNNKKIKHNQLFIMWGLITQTGNYLESFILPSFGFGCLIVSCFLKTV